MIIFRASFAFARKVKQLRTSLINNSKKTDEENISSESIESKEKVEKVNVPENQENLEQKEKKVFEKKFIKSPEYLMACNHQPALSLPEEILKKARKVFSKYPPDELRDASYKYMRMYQLLHALEKPVSVTIKRNNLFENPENLQKLTEKKVIHLYKKGTSEQQILDKIFERRQKKDVNVDRVNSAEEKLEEFHNFASAIDYDQILTVSYFLRKVPGSFAVGQKIMTEIQKRNPNFNPKSMLDYGSGIGTWAWSFKKLYPDVKNVVCVEPNVYMRKLGKFVTQDYIKDVKFYESLSHTLELSYDYFDFISIAYVLEEINHPEARLLALQSLWAKLSDDGVMVLVCPGSPTGFRFVNDFREWILKQKGVIVAPCQHQQTCPMAKEGFQWCHFKQMFTAWPKDVFPKYIYENTAVTEKFSYLAVSKKALVQEGQDWPRITFDPLKRGKHLILDMCTDQGTLERRIVAKSHGKEGGYYEAKHLNGGDLWRFPKLPPSKVGKKRRKQPVKIL
ncbi:unnamed protein product (macronuclear) [Paramecium tetraurelia]|uniref:Uncharacterized protein n=1 Tax=Paramecium tetraurelia TaxID=5888 RepID=A0DFF7_PARTE|nr:uncharacterized protein GSPATT00016587001 [Paramecium tetraurelia]CAK81774.1 unnamed protein product [Paramecium tetraurelia]|eukprot:XP_001449171.1 hypothetical protein (macronuclear) [Paramecium tetraurelia strain d4-2]